jgi:hypothetical protein
MTLGLTILTLMVCLVGAAAVLRLQADYHRLCGSSRPAALEHWPLFSAFHLGPFAVFVAGAWSARRNLGWAVAILLAALLGFVPGVLGVVIPIERDLPDPDPELAAGLALSCLSLHQYGLCAIPASCLLVRWASRLGFQVGNRADRSA